MLVYWPVVKRIFFIGIEPVSEYGRLDI